jgi:hypothetical protein
MEFAFLDSSTINNQSSIFGDLHKQLTHSLFSFLSPLSSSILNRRVLLLHVLGLPGLLGANALEIVLEESRAPANLTNQAGQDWIKRTGIALDLLYMSTSPKIRNTLATLLDRRDVVAMWEHLATFGPLLDIVYNSKLIQEFTLESFQPSDTVETYSQRLLRYQCKLQSSEYPISEPTTGSKTVSWHT